MRRGQAALEFLTTYGWALLVILVMLGALAYFGVINPNKFLPERCTFQQEVHCKDWIVTPNGGNLNVTFFITNNLGESMTNVAFSARITGETSFGSCTATGSTTIGAGASEEFVCASITGVTIPASGEKVKMSINGTFFKATGRYAHELQGEIFATIQ